MELKEFNEEEIRELISLFKNEQLDTYSFKLFERGEKLAEGKYDFISEDFYYNKLSSIFASFLPVYPPKDNTRLEYEEMILGDFISLSVLLDETYEAQK